MKNITNVFVRDLLKVIAPAQDVVIVDLVSNTKRAFLDGELSPVFKEYIDREVRNIYTVGTTLVIIIV